MHFPFLFLSHLFFVIDSRLCSYWAALVEKAAAKLRGSYAKMEAISMRDSMTMLVGAACVTCVASNLPTGNAFLC